MRPQLSLEQRQERLKRQNIRSKRAAVAFLCAISAFLVLLVAALGANAQQPGDKAPLPDVIVNAKTVYLTNETGKASFGDAVYKQIKTWNRWQVVSDKTQADLVLVVTGEGGMGSLNPSFYLKVLEPKTGSELWTSRTTMQGKLWRSWGSVAETLVGDIRKRMPNETK